MRDEGTNGPIKDNGYSRFSMSLIIIGKVTKRPMTRSVKGFLALDESNWSLSDPYSRLLRDVFPFLVSFLFHGSLIIK